jgi:hypothetical protein
MRARARLTHQRFLPVNNEYAKTLFQTPTRFAGFTSQNPIAKLPA